MALSPFLRPFGIAAAVLGIIQGVVWFILALLAIIIHIGAWKPVPSSSTYGGLLSNTILNGYLNGAIFGNLYLGPTTLFVWAILYLITSIFWVGLSSYQLWAILEEKQKLFKKTYLAWSIWSLIICICDLMLTSLLASDYSFLVQTANSQGAMVTTENFFKVLACGVVMTLAARGFVLWIINIAFAIIVLKLSVDLPKKISENHIGSSATNIFGGSISSTGWEDKPNRPRSNSFMSAKSFGTFQGLPRLPPVQSTNEMLTRQAKTNSVKSFGATHASANNSFLYSPSPRGVSPSSSGPRSPLEPPLQPALKNRPKSLYT